MKKAEYNSAGGSTGGDYRPVTYAATPSYVPDYLKSYNEPLFQGYAGSYKSSDLDMKVTEFPVPAASDSYGTFKNIETRVGDYS